MAVIHVLDQHTAELIAAGEVVERPASVVKELLENAIDAGATQVSVRIERGGIALIEVSDNGSGIETEYIPTAFIRHATSKISTERDLENIRTLGFRGEALASIASVARVEVLTCTEQDEFACRYRIEGGQEQGFEPAARPVGTTLSVRDLFYNTPARMKFLKKDASEGTFVAEAVQRIALSHPEVSISFEREGRRQFQTPGAGDLTSAIYSILGREFAKDLLPVEEMSGVYGVKGLITPPRACRASRGMQFFFINGRFVKNRTMMAALEAAYKGTLMQGKFPGGVLTLTLPGELVDVNVHPAKTEVRFARENDVFDAVYKAAKLALALPGTGEQHLHLGKNPAADISEEKRSSLEDRAPTPQEEKLAAGENAESSPSNSVNQIPFTDEEAAKTARISASFPEAESESCVAVPCAAARLASAGALCSRPLPYGAPRREPGLDVMVEEEEENISAVFPAVSFAAKKALVSEEPLVLSGLPQESQEKPTPSQTVLEGVEEEGPQQLRLVGEVFRTYIVAQRGKELCFIDKHAAHERILYEKLNAARGTAAGQLLLAPTAVQLSAAEKSALLLHAELLAENGLETEDFGGNAVLVRTVPADVKPDDVEDLVVELADRLISNGRDPLSEKTQWVLHSIACRAAVKAGDYNHSEELLALARQILDGEVPPFCPHGRPVILKLTQKELEKQFGRQG